MEGARIGMTENGGGTVGVEEASMTIHILGKVKSLLAGCGKPVSLAHSMSVRSVRIL